MWLLFAAQICFAVASAQTQIGGGTCSNDSLSGNYAFTLSGRQLASSGSFLNVTQSSGTVNFDGQGNATFALSTNTNQGSSQQSYNGTYNLPSNCLGTLMANISASDVASFTVAVFGQGRSFALSGSDGSFTFGGGGNLQPASCLVSTLSGVYSINANGFSVASKSVAGLVELTGLLQFDGQGNITANLNVTSGSALSTVTAGGQYSATNNCVYAATLADSTGVSYTLAMSVATANGADFDVIGTNPLMIFSGTSHASFGNPSQSVVNGASFRPSYAPAGAIFSIFGQNLATAQAQASSVPLPHTLLSTSVMVNGQPAPLFYVSSNQINAQLPADIQPGLATIVVKNGNSASNAAAFTVPETGPGIFVFGQNRAVVQNPDHRVNTETTPARVGDILVAYFTGGGPVENKGLNTGTPAPIGLYPVAQNSFVTLSGKAAAQTYVGLAPGFIGLYQANFKVPKVAAGDHPLVINIGGKASNAPVITISN